jgi:hypothetical protein
MVFGQKNEMEVQGPIAVEHDVKAAILLLPLAGRGPGRQKEIGRNPRLRPDS